MAWRVRLVWTSVGFAAGVVVTLVAVTIGPVPGLSGTDEAPVTAAELATGPADVAAQGLESEQPSTGPSPASGASPEPGSSQTQRPSTPAQADDGPASVETSRLPATPGTTSESAANAVTAKDGSDVASRSIASTTIFEKAPANATAVSRSESERTTAVPAASTEEAAAEADDTEAEADSLTELELMALASEGWRTDFSRHTVPYDEILPAGPTRDGIPPIDGPRFTDPKSASDWLGDIEPVVAFELNGKARAYPLQILTWHEIVNDIVGGVPVTVTFCPLCNSAIVFDRRLDGVVYSFGTSGKLRHSDLIMWDRQTQTWWQQLTGEGIVGELAGRRLTMLPASLVSFADFKSAYPDGKVLTRNTGFERPYGENPYVGYDRVDSAPFLFRGTVDGRLFPKDRVVAVTVDDVDAAFPYWLLEEKRVVNQTVNGKDLVVFYKTGTVSALNQLVIQDSRDVGSTGVFDAYAEGRKLTFRADGGRFVDEETGSVWSILGKALEGPLSGTELTPILHGDHFWFAWAAFKPDTIIYP